MSKVLVEVSEFKLQLRYYVVLRTNTLRKSIEALSLTSKGLNSITADKDDFVVK